MHFISIQGYIWLLDLFIIIVVHQNFKINSLRCFIS